MASIQIKKDMKVGDKVYIVSDDKRNKADTYCTVSKVGKKYFEVEGMCWDKFMMPGVKHPNGLENNKGVRTKDHYISSFYWHESKEAYDFEQEVIEARRIIVSKINLLTAEEALEIVEKIKERMK